MKYGKEFQQIIDDPSLPPEWKSSAIEYRRLKKLIKDVVAELSSMGLSPEVLNKLLVTESDDPPTAPELSVAKSTGGDDGDILEFEFESDEASPPTFSSPTFAPRPHVPQEVTIDPIDHLDEDGESDHEVAGPSSLPHHHHRTFRLRLLSETQPEKPAPIRPMGVMDMVRSQNEARRRALEGAIRKPKPVARPRGRVRKARVDDQGVKAEYVLTGDPERPTPQLRLHVATASPDRGSSPSGKSSSPSRSLSTTDSDRDVLTSESEDDIPQVLSRLASPQHTPRPFRRLDAPRIDIIPPSPTLQKLRQAVSPIWALASGNNISDGLRDLSLDGTLTPKAEHHPLAIPTVSSRDTQGTVTYGTSPPTASSPSKERDFIIPLASDLAFFNLLTAALTSLSAFHAAQQEAFRISVQRLCVLISDNIQPGSGASVQVISSPLTPSPLDSGLSSSTAVLKRGGPSKSKQSKKDLYAWREIFTMWIEAEIFESSAERTRGERTVEAAEARLQAFAAEVVKRGLGDRRTMTGKKVRGAWDEFLRLNVLLLDLKRFQQANINAARKILKKHDKRTALTASAGFPAFVRSTLSNQVDKDGNVSTWSFYNTSLPHVLLASLTDTLLPILPSLDDYACLICTSIAFKPIRLGCSHLFCVRCLVKMQRAGKGECPLCRSQVVLLADKNSLDLTLMNYMKEWFPKEVKMKEKENSKEIAFEQAAGTAEIDTKCTIM